MWSTRTYLYSEYRGVQRSMEIVHEVLNCISLYTKYKHSMSYDSESLQPDDVLYDTESLRHIHMQFRYRLYSSQELIIPGGLENLHSTTKMIDQNQTLNYLF